MDEDGVQLGGKRAAILYAHRLREAAPAAVVVDEGEEAAKADGKTGGDEEKVSSEKTDLFCYVFRDTFFSGGSNLSYCKFSKKDLD